MLRVSAAESPPIKSVLHSAKQRGKKEQSASRCEVSLNGGKTTGQVRCSRRVLSPSDALSKECVAGAYDCILFEVEAA